jgi:hypothetical protein
MSENLRSVTVRLQTSLFEQLAVIAEKKGETLSDTIRYFIARGMDERICQENTKLISRIVREQMEQVMAQYSAGSAPLSPEQAPRQPIKPVDPRRLALCRKIS